MCGACLSLMGTPRPRDDMSWLDSPLAELDRDAANF
jgi:hypothetical protein